MVVILRLKALRLSGQNCTKTGKQRKVLVGLGLSASTPTYFFNGTPMHGPHLHIYLGRQKQQFIIKKTLRYFTAQQTLLQSMIFHPDYFRTAEVRLNSFFLEKRHPHPFPGYFRGSSCNLPSPTPYIVAQRCAIMNMRFKLAMITRQDDSWLQRRNALQGMAWGICQSSSCLIMQSAKKAF